MVFEDTGRYAVVALWLKVDILHVDMFLTIALLTEKFSFNFHFRVWAVLTIIKIDVFIVCAIIFVLFPFNYEDHKLISFVCLFVCCCLCFISFVIFLVCLLLLFFFFTVKCHFRKTKKYFGFICEQFDVSLSQHSVFYV